MERRAFRRRGGTAVGETRIRCRIVAIGRLRAGPLKDLAAFYEARIRPPLALVELEARQKLPPPELRAREAELILAAVPKEVKFVALDGRGEEWSSRDLARRLAAWRDAGAAELAFAIGGAEGLDRSVLDRADAVLSLGPMTWPHFLVRGMLLEQLYRAQQILKGHPYHRE